MPWNWFKLQPHKTDSTASKTLSLVRGGNAQLGNCYKSRLAGDTYGVLFVQTWVSELSCF